MNLWDAADYVGSARNVDPNIIYAQWMHESNRGQELGGANNYGGVKEWNGSGNTYHDFDSIDDFAGYMSRYYSKFDVDGSATPEEFVTHLYEGGYFTDNYDTYVNDVRQLYDEGAKDEGDSGVSSEALDFSIITPNNTDQTVTNTENLQPEAIAGTNMLAKWIKATTDDNLSLTGGAEKGYHEKSESGHGHEDGWKIDVGNINVDPEAFKSFCNSNGWSANFEKDHWDVDFSGADNRDPQKGFSGDPLQGLSGAADLFGSSMSTGQQNTPAYDAHEHDFDPKPSFWDALITNFADSATTTGVAYVGQSLWGNLFHSSNHFGRMDDVSQEDIEYVKNALPNDTDAQKYALLNGRDSEEIRWLVNQKLVDKNRREEVAQWRAGNENMIARGAMALAGGLGYLADPINFIPYANAFNGLKIAARLGEAAYDASKLARVASTATKVGLEGATAITLDNVMKEGYGGEKPDYGWDAALAFAGGAVLGGLGGLWKNLGKGNYAEDVIKAADSAETKAYYHAADMDPKIVHSETIDKARALHDPEYGKEVNSKYYNELEKNGRVVATTYENARELVSRAAGIDIPKGTKAFYVPNEDYAMLITDNLGKGEAVNVLAHEFSVHAGLEKSLGTKAYTKLMDDVSTLSEKDGHIFNQAREKAGSYDPEEIFAYALENNMLPKGILSNLKGAMNSTFKTNGIKTKVTQEQMMSLLKQQAGAAREASSGIHYNPDGSTVFAGIKFSKDNFLNPAVLANFYTLEKAVTKDTQKDLPWFFPKDLGRALEQGTAGMTINSTSNTVRKFANLLHDDPRGRGLGNVTTMSAETNRQRVIRKLSEPLLNVYSERQAWCLANKNLGRSAQMAYNKLLMLAYNARKECGNRANIPSEFHPEVMNGVKHLEELDRRQIEMMKNSARDVGSKSDNLIEADWEPVDFEFRRVVDNDMRIKFLNKFFNDNTTGKSSYQGASKFLEDYYKAFAKRDVIKDKIVRDIEKENKKIQEYNDKIPAGSKRQPKPLKSTIFTDDAIDNWMNERIPAAIDRILKGDTDIISEQGMGKIGSLPFLKERIPIDTTGVMKLPSGKEFSFDNDLRSFDLDSICEKNNSRIAGECAIKNVFNNQKDLDNFLAQAKAELTKSTDGKAINPSDRDKTIRLLKDDINELRGMRPNMDALSRAGVVCRILKNLTYATRGTNMLWAQLGELGGTMAYGGATQLFHAFGLGKVVNSIKYGKMGAQDLEDTMHYMSGENMASKIFTTSYGDRVTRDALTKDSIVDSSLKMVADISANLGKVTSAVNFLPKMTDAMEKGMMECTIMDAIQWASGRTFSNIRNPFSKAKLKAAHISETDAKYIKDGLVAFKKDSGYGLDIEAWQKADPISYAKFYNLVQRQVDRAIVSGTRIGNRALFKEVNPMVSLMFQFKDYTLRAVNAQSMRAMTARDLDDALATSFSIVTNMASYAARAGFMYGSYKAIGADEMAQDKFDKMMSPENLARVAAFRSTILGSPFSFVNDVYEGATGSQTIRTTVNRNTGRPINGAEDLAGNFVAQSPALDVASAPYDIYKYVMNNFDNRASKRDFKDLINVIPYTNWIPFSSFINNYVDKSGYPDKRPKRPKQQK